MRLTLPYDRLSTGLLLIMCDVDSGRFSESSACTSGSDVSVCSMETQVTYIRDLDVESYLSPSTSPLCTPERIQNLSRGK